MGHLTHQFWLIRLRADLQAMSPATALVVVILAGSMIAAHFGRRRTGRALALATGLCSLLLFAADIALGRDTISPALIGLLQGQNAVSVGETSPATAACLGLLAAGALLPKRRQPTAALAVIVMLVSGLAALGYLYGVRDLYALSPFRAMSLRTAVAIFALATAMLLANPRLRVAQLLFGSGLVAASARRQLGFLVFPPIVAFGLVWTIRLGGLGIGAAMAVLVMVMVAPLALLVLRDARASTDLDEERRAKDELEVRYHTLFNRLETGFCVVEVAFDAQGSASDYRFLEINPAFTAQTGLPDAEGRWMRSLAPDHEQHWFDTYGQVATSGEPVRFEQEAEALGRFFDVYAFRIGAPEAHRVAILFSDISLRRAQEVRLQTMNETLEARVAERARELELSQEALRQSQKLEAIGQLTGGVAHDFNNLLTVIRGSTDLLRRPDISEDRRVRYVDAIAETADRAIKLTSQLLAFARRQALQPELFDVGASLKEVSGMIGTMAGSRIDLQFQLPVDPCFIMADRSQFDTAIVNLAINARDAMNGEGCIIIAAGPVSGIPALRTDAAVAGDFVAVTVTDTGEGILGENLNKVFEPFFTTKAVGAGTGLGLSQVIGFASQSGGNVNAASRPGEGATFTVYLPRAYPAEGGASTTLQPEVQISAEGICVLVVEDNPQVGEFATRALNELGFESTLAPDAHSALEQLSHDCTRFHIVFSDVVMPGMSGLDMAQEIRNLYPGVPIVLTSGYSHVLAQNGDHGFELLHKPYSIEQLARVLQKALAWQRRSGSRVPTT